LSIVGHGALLGLFRALLWVWLATVVVVLVGMTYGAYRRLGRGDLVSYVRTAMSVPAVVVYLAVANAGAIVAAALGRRSPFTRTPKTGV
jgi:hypothetical protein